MNDLSVDKQNDGNPKDDILKNVRSMNEYQQAFCDACNDSTSRISTGFRSLDKKLCGGLVSELYVLGAETSIGKSALIMQMAQNVSAQGVDVLYFALEMSKREFVARGISTISYIKSLNDETTSNKVTASDVLYWKYDKQEDDFFRMPYERYQGFASEYFKRYGEHLYIIEGGTKGLTVKDIANMASVFKARNKGKPVVVFVDYLQIIRADAEDRSQVDRKTKTDICVATLKTLASQIGMPVFVVSSISRQKYREKVNGSSYKESGDTEYTGGILLGYNWKGVTDQKDDTLADAEKKMSKMRGYRLMTLEILKNRNSERDVEISLKYYPEYNYFEEVDTQESRSYQVKG